MAVNSLAICGRTKETVIFGKKRVILKLKIGKLEELKFNHHFQETPALCRLQC
jgi:hypothetical protein